MDSFYHKRLTFTKSIILVPISASASLVNWRAESEGEFAERCLACTAMRSGGLAEGGDHLDTRGDRAHDLLDAVTRVGLFLRDDQAHAFQQADILGDG